MFGGGEICGEGVERGSQSFEVSASSLLQAVCSDGDEKSEGSTIG